MNARIETETTTELEAWDSFYEKFPPSMDSPSGITPFEKSAILKGIRAELVERQSERKFLKGERERIHDAQEIERLNAQCVEYLEEIDGLKVALEEEQGYSHKLETKLDVKA